MKKIIVYINTFIMFLLTIIFILFIELQIELRPNNIITNLEKINYYQKAYSNVLQNLDDIIVNDKLKEELIQFYSIDILKKDVNLIVRGNKINHYDEIKTIVSKYSKDKKAIEKYSKDVNSIIDNNIFMTSEYKKLNKIYFNIYDCLFATIIFIIIQFIFLIINYLLIKKLYFIKEIILSTSIILILPKLLLMTSNILNNFTYGNKYFSELIVFFINTYCNKLFMISIVGITTILCLNDFTHKYKNK